jgi:hypothetical protein
MPKTARRPRPTLIPDAPPDWLQEHWLPPNCPGRSALCAILSYSRRGKHYAVVTDNAHLVAVQVKQAPPAEHPELDSKVSRYLAHGSGAHRTSLAALRRWAGRSPSSAEQLLEKTASPGRIAGMVVNRHLLAFALRRFRRDEPVLVRHQRVKIGRSDGSCLQLRGDRWLVAVMEFYGKPEGRAFRFQSRGRDAPHGQQRPTNTNRSRDGD